MPWRYINWRKPSSTAAMLNANFISSGLALALLLAGCAGQPATAPENQPAKPVAATAPAFIPDKALIAQWLGYQETTAAVFDGLARHGQPTATGEPFDMYGLVAAHSRVPLGALIQVDAGGRSLVPGLMTAPPPPRRCVCPTPPLGYGAKPIRRGVPPAANRPASG
jgi:hypothetical protein